MVLYCAAAFVSPSFVSVHAFRKESVIANERESERAQSPDNDDVLGCVLAPVSCAYVRTYMDTPSREVRVVVVFTTRVLCVGCVGRVCVKRQVRWTCLFYLLSPVGSWM